MYIVFILRVELKNKLQVYPERNKTILYGEH